MKARLAQKQSGRCQPKVSVIRECQCGDIFQVPQGDTQMECERCRVEGETLAAEAVRA